jgi:ribonucleoside-diphosphate reductase alpha chain
MLLRNTANGHIGAFAQTIINDKYSHTLPGGRKETWDEVAERQGLCVVQPYLPELVSRVTEAVRSRKFLPGGRYLYAAGRRYHAVNNCFLFRAQDSREGWADLWRKAGSSLMCGGGVGVDYSLLRREDAPIEGMGGKSTGPLSLAMTVNEQGRHIRQGGSRRSAIWAGILWSHPDAMKFVCCKDWPHEVAELKFKDFNFPAPMDGTNVSIILDDEFFQAYHNPGHDRFRLAQSLYWACIHHMLETGEPGFSIDVGENTGETLRNACTEVVSSDDGDMCNLTSINLARVDTIEEFEELVAEVAVPFMLCGTLYSKLPLPEMYAVREKNRRLGLGLMGVHEWLLRRGYRYGPCDELASWLQVYARSGAYAHRWADKLSISRPVATRAMAPNGTIGIVGETTTSAEPITALAYKRRYLRDGTWHARYLVDAAAQRLIEVGVDPNQIEDAYDLARDVERRVAFQAWFQKYVDHGISSTINMPPWGTEYNNEGRVNTFGSTLMRYLPELRGVTVYPDGARGGQPITKVPYEEAVAAGGAEFVEHGETMCRGGACGV